MRIDAGVVHEDVNPTLGREDRPEGLCDAELVRHVDRVRRHGEGTPRHRSGSGRDSFAVHIQKGHPRPFRREPVPAARPIPRAAPVTTATRPLNGRGADEPGHHEVS